ncbi:bifunctional PIG-L family deacetylase/class I SAM-dependent methyltransferase [Leifsonia sp. fls2-241-R2A-40a]|uniref:bifunctional PIG-L family deacetylase/class I SAM-dependent methyltransferase n=1 Tax=Leifsonia sp. fls2-241-R2A-40a TaxID=3040290 RepID=UPI00254EA1BA|nr:bifunctional PIG-L family deacetylase/class I SAM-dependent methyltransferase [Leifsonia sp. fls2-241-R2A-40a]
MVTFDPYTAVTSPAVWESLPQWDDVPELADRSDDLVVFSAHPDDETLGVGGLLARAAARNASASVVVATASDPDRLGELAAALDALGFPRETGDARIRPLGLPDGALKHSTLELRAAIRRELDAAPGIPVTRLVLAPWTGDRHGDHRALGREVVAAARERGERVLLYPVWLWQWGTPDDVPWRRTVRVPLEPAERARKQDALARFVTQLRSPAHPDGVLDRGFVERAGTGQEVLFEPPPAADDHFERMHSERDDPWRVRTRWYERRRRAVLTASLPRERYARGLELGCSIGETTAVLADRCDVLTAVDGSAAAVEAAARLLHDRPTVTVEQRRIPDEWPDGADGADLVVVSELAYYFAEPEWDAVTDRILGSLRAGGDVVLCHWTGDADDFAQTAESAHARFIERSGMRPVVRHIDEEFVLEVLR